MTKRQPTMSNVVEAAPLFGQAEPVPNGKPSKPLQPKEIPSKPVKPDDDEIADELIQKLDGNYRYFHGQWYFYTVGCWRPIKSISADVIRLVKSKRYVGVRPSKARCQSVEWFVETELALEDESVVDNEPSYINLQNGLFNLDTFKLEPHQRDKYITCQAPFAYDPEAVPDIFDIWLRKMLVNADGERDESLVRLVQEAMGYTLTADVSHRVSFWLVGPTGSGKSTLINTMVALMQDYHTVLNLNELGQNRFMLASLPGKRLVTFGESEASLKLADGAYKTLVSSDGINADVKNRDSIYFVPQYKIWWGMNNLPYLSDRSGAVDSRVILVPFRKSIPRTEWDLTLDKKIQAELPGVFNWALTGLKRLRNVGHFTQVEQVEAFKQEYQHANDVYANFLSDERWCLPGGKTALRPLWKAFEAWAQDQGVKYHANSVTVKREWERLGLRERHSGSRFFEGVSLTKHAQKYSET